MWPRPLRRILLSFHPPKPKPLFQGIVWRRSSASASPVVRPRVIMPSVHKFANDRIFIENLQLKCVCGPDAFNRLKEQPFRLSVDVGTSVARAAASDAVELSVDYSALNKELLSLETATYDGVRELMERVAALAGVKEGVGSVGVTVEVDKGVLGAEKVIWMLKVAGEDRELRVGVKGVQVMVIVGIKENLHERTIPQPVVFDVEWELVPDTGGFKLQDIISSIVKDVSKTNYESIESLSTLIASLAQTAIPSKVNVTLRKPNAIPFAKASGVSITRPYRPPSRRDSHQVFIALGSNLGDRLGTIEKSLHALEDSGVRIEDVSGLYESEPMYVEEQPQFLNAVARASTKLAPLDLLTVLKQIEDNLGRVPTIRNGPRTLDLDILLYDDEIISHPDLIVPHMSMLERSFVLQPLADLAPKALHPLSFSTIQSHLAELPPPAQHQVVPLRHGKLELDVAHHRKRTLIMGILNLTPDSFSDGGLHSLLPAEIVATAQKMVDNGADIIDVGGQSTRPDAEDVGPAAEIERVIPAIKAIREAGLQVPLSIDTYRADVARAAIDAGADIINDVSAGTLDPRMFTVAAELNVPIILMHMRGNPKTMNSLTKYKDMIPEIAAELSSCVDDAVKAGIRRWNILLDPGLGFAKIRAQNLDVLQRLEDLRWADGLGGLGWVVGPSRKSFVGWVTGEMVPRERVWGTAAAVTACVAGGADIVRIHDVGEMGRVVKMGDAIWRGVR